METCRVQTLFWAVEGRHNTNPSLVLENLLILLFSTTSGLISIAQVPERSLEFFSEALFFRIAKLYPEREIDRCLASLGQPGRSFPAWSSLD